MANFSLEFETPSMRRVFPHEKQQEHCLYGWRR